MAQGEPFIRADMKALLDMLGQADGPSIGEVPAEVAREIYVRLHAMADLPPRELAVIRDLACPGPAGEIPLRLYDAREEREAGRAIVFFHGGGFTIGSLETHHNLCTEIAAEMDLPVIAVDYRLAPEHPFPAPLDDCEAAARWIAEGQAWIGREFTGLVLIGDSAGGSAAIAVSQQLEANPAAVPVVLQVPIYPAVNNTMDSASMAQFGEGHILTKLAVQFFDRCYAHDWDDPRAAPLLGNVGSTPPTVLVTASLDSIRDSGREYGAALARAGIDHIFLEMKGLTHSFINLRQVVPSTQQDVARIFAAMKLMLESGET